MNRHIEKLKRDIAADDRSRDLLEIQELTAQLHDLSHNLSLQSRSGPDPAAMLEAAIRSYWGALILARKAIEKAEKSRQSANALGQIETPLTVA